MQIPYAWGCVDSLNRIRRGTGKLVKVVSTRGNQKAKSVGMGRDFPKKYPGINLDRLAGHPIYRRDRGIRDTSRQISFEFLFIKTRPPHILDIGS